MEDTKKYTWKDIQIHDEERRYFINAAQTAIVIAEGKFGITFHLYRLDDDGLYYARYGREKLTGDTVTMDIDEPNDEIFKEVLVLPEKCIQ